MSLSRDFSLIFAMQLIATVASAATTTNVCQTTETPTDVDNRRDYFAVNQPQAKGFAPGVCAPGTVTKYISAGAFSSDGSPAPCFQMVYLGNPNAPSGTTDPLAGRVVPEVCFPDKNTCEPLIRPGESVSVQDLQAIAKTPDDDSGSLKNRLLRALGIGITVAQKGLAYTAVSFPLGGGIQAFLSDMGDQMSSSKDDKAKAKAAAADLRNVFQSLLGTAPDPNDPKNPLSCNDNTRAPYKTGKALTGALSAFFTDLASKNPKTDLGMGSNTTTDSEFQDHIRDLSRQCHFNGKNNPTLLNTCMNSVNIIKNMVEAAQGTIQPTEAALPDLIPEESVSSNNIVLKPIQPVTTTATDPTPAAAAQ